LIPRQVEDLHIKKYLMRIRPKPIILSYPDNNSEIFSVEYLFKGGAACSHGSLATLQLQ